MAECSRPAVRRRWTIEEQMARVKQKQKATPVRTSTSSRGVRVSSGSAMTVLIVSTLATLWAAVMLTGAGQRAYAYGFFFTEFFAGVVTLVSLSLTVMMGLLATDRLVLLIRHRVLLQSAHRATGVLGVAGLGLHVLTKIATGRAASTDAVVPFVSGTGLYVGLGTVAALLMVAVLWTGIVRARFANVGPKWLWRALHSTAYASWPFALVHGLNAGRAAKPWVTLSYLVCVLLVVAALLVRLSVTLGRRSREQNQAAARNKALAARPAEEGRRPVLGLGRRGEAKRAAEAARQRRDAEWAQATAEMSVPSTRRGADRFAVPVVPEPAAAGERTRSRGRRRDEEPARTGASSRRAGRYRDERDERDEPATRRPRDEGFEPAGRGSRNEEVEPAARRSRRRRAQEPEPTGRVSASARSRRRADDHDESGTEARIPVPARRVDEPEEPWTSPSRWEATEPVSAEPISAQPTSGGRHSVEDDTPEEPDYWRPPTQYLPEEAPVDDTPTLVDLASRRARRAAGEGRASRRRRANADAVDGAYWAGLRGEAK
ncbi:ferric reductase-like transmembrane domain-containing protein [Micromonospora musae]|uniref:ferric reductase-like transmembrane domain-containing protein n=1 Tax=Micromonospora musae TaxID=1894970 RepID=UPI0034449517